jgi:acetyl-CoA C-acetyltransferase
MACHELGIDPWSDSRPLTVTGGLSFAGGPGNNYATHAVCSLVGRLREDPDSAGLSTAVGWYMTKHAAAVFGAGEPGRRLASVDARAQASALPSRIIAEGRFGPATAEAATVVYDREGQPTVATLTGIFADGSRGVAHSTEPGLLEQLAGESITGRPMTFAGDGTATVA